MRKSFQPVVFGVLFFFAVLAVILFFAARPKPIPPLPFDDKVFIETKPHNFPAGKNAPIFARVFLFSFKVMERLRGPNAATWSFPVTTKMACFVQGLLYQCANVSGMRYLMPLGVAAGTVQFGNTNTLNGSQWVAAFEKELQTGDVQRWDSKTQSMRREHFVLLRFPAQKTVVVLPESDSAEFQRTNGIHLSSD